MNITPQKYAQGLYELTQDKKEKNEINIVLQKFVSVLSDNRDLLKMDDILKHFVKIYNTEANILDVELISRFKLDDQMINELKQYIRRKTNFQNINIVNKIDENILGGVIIKYNDQVLDMSLSSTLRQLKRKMID